MDKIVVIPKGFRNLRIHKSSYVKYFTPRVIKMQTGQTNTWINKDVLINSGIAVSESYQRILLCYDISLSLTIF